MALIKCKECGHDVSNKAETCPNCGAKVTPKAGCGTIVGTIFFAAVALAAISSIFDSSSGTSGGTPAASSESSDCKPNDLQCLGDKGIIGASVYCQNAIEKFAIHSVKWTDGTFDTKFSRFRWRDQAKGEITYVGDKVEFQNGFGAFTPMIYECDLAADDKTVLDARVLGEGRLP